MRKLRLPKIPQWLIVLGIFICVFSSIYGLYIIAIGIGEDLPCWSARSLPYFVLESQSHFSFPPSAHNVTIKTNSRWSWCDVQVRFEMQASDLDRFVSSTIVGTLTANNTSARNYWRTLSDLDFKASAVKSSLFGYNDTDYFNQQYVYVDTTNSEIYIVYLSTSQGFLD